MPTVGQRGFWDEQRRVTKLQDKKPVLKRLADSIPWESFRPLLEKGYEHERKSNAGRKRIDPLILFKMLVLQQLFNLSDEELEFQVNDRRSFEEFVGLGVMNSIPDATTVAFFRERLRKAGVIEELFEMFEGYLRSQGLQARGGQIIDATLVPVPRQRNSREDNKEIKLHALDYWQVIRNRYGVILLAFFLVFMTATVRRLPLSWPLTRTKPSRRSTASMRRRS